MSQLEGTAITILRTLIVDMYDKLRLGRQQLRHLIPDPALTCRNPVTLSFGPARAAERPTTETKFARNEALPQISGGQGGVQGTFACLEKWCVRIFPPH